MTRVLIGVPCYNCAPQIGRVIRGLNEISASETFFSFFFVDNRSTDTTLETINEKAKILKNLTVVQNDQNSGLGGSQKRIFAYAIEQQYDAVLVLHGDDQASCEDISRLVSLFQQRPAHYLGSRFMLDSKRIGYQRTRVFGNVSLNLIFSIVTRRAIKDLGSGINLFDVRQLTRLRLENLSNQFNFNVELLLLFISQQQTFTFVPILWRETDQVSNARNFKVAFSMLKSLWRWIIHSSRGKT